MSQPRPSSCALETELEKLINALTKMKVVCMAGVCAGHRPLPQPGEGDVDIFILCSQIPIVDDRRAVYTTFFPAQDDFRVGVHPGGYWGQADVVELAGVETWLMYFQRDEVLCFLDDILAGLYPDEMPGGFFPTGRCATFLGMRALYDPENWLAGIQAHLLPFPEPLAYKLLMYHLDCLKDVEDLDRAVLRSDVLFYHRALDEALSHFFQALFALNRIYFPSRKRSLEHIAGFSKKPKDCESRLLEVVSTGAGPQSLRCSREMFAALVLDLAEISKEGS